MAGFKSLIYKIPSKSGKVSAGKRRMGNRRSYKRR